MFIDKQCFFLFLCFFSPANTYLISERSLNDLLLNTIFCHSGSWLGRTVNQGKVEGTDGWWVGTWRFLCLDSKFHIPCTLAVTLCSQVYRCGPGSHNKQQRDGPDLEAKPVWLRLRVSLFSDGRVKPSLPLSSLTFHRIANPPILASRLFLYLEPWLWQGFSWNALPAGTVRAGSFTSLRLCLKSNCAFRTSPPTPVRHPSFLPHLHL